MRITLALESLAEDVRAIRAAMTTAPVAPPVVAQVVDALLRGRTRRG